MSTASTTKTKDKRIGNRNNKVFQTLSQAERPTAARHVARRRISDDWDSSSKVSDEEEGEVKDDEEKKITEMSGVRVLHRERGFEAPTSKDSYHYQRVLQGIKKQLGNHVKQKLHITPEILLHHHHYH